MHPDSRPPPAAAPPLRVAVDLSILRPGGENGGIKPFLFETLLWLGRQERVPLRFLYLTCARTHAEVRDTLARIDDETICVRDDGGPLPHGDERAPRERRCVPPPPDLLWQLGAQVLYCPFGPVDFALPGVGRHLHGRGRAAPRLPVEPRRPSQRRPRTRIPGNPRRGGPPAMHLAPRRGADARALRRAARADVHGLHRHPPALRGDGVVQRVTAVHRAGSQCRTRAVFLLPGQRLEAQKPRGPAAGIRYLPRRGAGRRADALAAAADRPRGRTLAGAARPRRDARFAGR